ncbi:UNVERIFIED_CONTAM: hypothetical protein Sangu_0531500 [Sesamum angustifolium]|uniref:K-box domain-containing protein n=1 Tax=Sesamum angustifolium TaxID=2727405 RepID=A0AAW2Q987_9LAMI
MSISFVCCNFLDLYLDMLMLSTMVRILCKKCSRLKGVDPAEHLFSLTEILQQYQNCVAMGPDAQTAVHGTRVRFTSSCNPTVQLGHMNGHGTLAHEISRTKQNVSHIATSMHGRSEIQICRELGETCVDNLTVTDLVHLEKQLEDALIQIRATKTHLLLDSISTLHEKEKMLAEEKRHLEEKIAGSKADGRTNKMIMDLNVIADSQMTE